MDVADDDRPVVAQPHGHALHPHARVPATRVRHRALRHCGADLRRDRPRRRAVASLAARRPRPRRPGGAVPLAEPAVLRLRAREDERLDDRADPRRNADLRGADRDRVRAGEAVAEVLARGCDLVRRRRARRGRRPRRLLRRLARQPARNRDGGDVGRLFGRDHAADGALHGVTDQCRRPVARLGADRSRRLPPGGGPGLRRGLAGVGAARVRDAPARSW